MPLIHPFSHNNYSLRSSLSCGPPVTPHSLCCSKRAIYLASQSCVWRASVHAFASLLFCTWTLVRGTNLRVLILLSLSQHAPFPEEASCSIFCICLSYLIRFVCTVYRRLVFCVLSFVMHSVRLVVSSAASLASIVSYLLDVSFRPHSFSNSC